MRSAGAEAGGVRPDLLALEYVVCVADDGYPASLELHQFYRVLPAIGPFSVKYWAE